VTAEAQRRAAALAYRAGDVAPRVVAKGQGLVAEEIIRRAREAGLFVHESRELVSLLMEIDLDQRIPEELYLAIAELLAWVYRIEHRITPPSGSPPIDETNEQGGFPPVCRPLTRGDRGHLAAACGGPSAGLDRL